MFKKIEKFIAQSIKKREELAKDITKNKLNCKNVNKLLFGNSDIIVKNINLNSNKSLKASLFYVDGMVDIKTLDENILKPLSQENEIRETNNENEIIKNIINGAVYHTKTSETGDLAECINQILNGSAALIFDGVNKAIIFEVKGFQSRSVTEPANENVVKGSKEAFIEVLRVNTTMVRRKLRTHKLKIKQIIVGKQSITPVAIIYIDGITNMDFVTDLEERLQKIDIDGAIMAGSIEEYIIDHKYSPFPQAAYTERVDAFCYNLLEGRVGLLIDGLPIAFNVPVTLDMFFRAPEEYSTNYIVTSGIRIIRYFSALISTTLPAFYISITTFHQEMIPSRIAISIIKSKEGVPFPTFIEVILLVFAFEIILEAGIRLPKPIGQALSIVGALIVGDAAVTARVVSPVVVIIVALTAICGFVIPKQDMSNVIRLIRMFLIILSAIYGLYGLVIGIICICIHLSRMNSFGVSYMAPFTSTEGKGMFSDSLFRLPMFMIKTRPENLKTLDKKRQK